MNLTQHFTFEEFTATRSHPELQALNRERAKDYVVNMSLVAAQLETLRGYITRPVIVTSGFRCPELNTAVGGSPNSQHLLGDAADFTVKDFTDITGLSYLFEWCRRHLAYGQLILERPAADGSRPWIHIGMPRPGRPPTAFVFKDGKYLEIK